MVLPQHIRNHVTSSAMIIWTKTSDYNNFWYSYHWD